MTRHTPNRLLLTCFLIIIAIESLILINITRQFQSQSKLLSDLTAKLDVLQPTASAPNEKVISALTALQEEIIRYRAEQSNVQATLGMDATSSLSASIDQALATITDTSVVSPYEPLVKVVKLKTGWDKVDLYQQMRAGSKIIGQVIANQDYVVEDSKKDWYKIRLNSLTGGWIQAQFVYEVN